VPKFKETLKDVRNEQAARELTNMYLDYYMEYFQYKQLARQKIDELKKSLKMATKKSTVKKATVKKTNVKKAKRSKSKSKTKK
jgi:hypothetical protein